MRPTAVYASGCLPEGKRGWSGGRAREHQVDPGPLVHRRALERLLVDHFARRQIAVIAVGNFAELETGFIQGIPGLFQVQVD
ncbi:MAG: hypothetical protein A2Z86_05315 [Candidatus Glassbacteria bacterium GWA2_58_10]|uniref:Uncharacterized protein n=1 Tax=Candidatus Glassbacteria bacterium GWA2_58_10 TaxID=1817865 RepID=A0A1F5YE06_9BACT|nr:MAG: hypothetical protein A2Z86_05315 [Candidatus Glassbacteria bacterium GWA2_58_10]